MSVASSALKSVVLTTLVMLGFLLFAAVLWLPTGQPRDEAPEQIARRNATADSGAHAPQQVTPEGTAQPSPTQTSEFERLAGGTASALAGGTQPTAPPGRGGGSQKPAPVPAWMRDATPQPSANNAAQASRPPAAESPQPPQHYEQPVAETVQRQLARSARADSAPNPAALVGELSGLGYRVHATLSGAGKATTLSVTGATLTRQAGAQWLSDPRTRQGLKAAGVSIVVLLNGEESWTFML
jgi:hypothetical protein